MKNSVIALSLLTIFFLVLVSGCTNLSNSNYGKITINSTPSGAEVYLNNTYKGTTPNVIDTLSPGAYEIELRLKEYQTYSELITIQPNDVHHISISLIPITPAPTPIPIQSSKPTLTPIPILFPTPGSSQTEEPGLLRRINYQISCDDGTPITDEIPLTIVVKGGLSHTSRDLLTFSGTGPKCGYIYKFFITDSTGFNYYYYNVVGIRSDGTWSFDYDLRKIPINLGPAKFQISTYTKTEDVIINIVN
jgi:hypothetical protein